MGKPSSNEARLFHRCALLRREDAEILLKAQQTTGAVYLAGYGVECILKALVLSNASPKKQMEILRTFRGSRAHDFEWLRSLYLTGGGPRFPREITEAFTLVDSWSTDLRYVPRTLRCDEAEDFVEAVDRIITWANGRL
jgi:HEPN domain-containing protein